jgi:hypothetical protein
LVLIIISLLSGAALPSDINLIEINRLEYLEKTYKGVENVRLKNGKLFSSGQKYLDIKFYGVVFADINNDGIDDAVVAYCYFSRTIQMVQSIMCVVIDENVKTEVTDFKHYYGSIN